MSYNLSEIRARAFDHTLNGVVITDPTKPDNPIIDVNKTFETLTGYTRDEVLGRNCRFLQAYNARQEVLAELRLAIHRNEECKVVLKNYRKDGSMFWNELTIIPIVEDNGTVLSYLGVIQDITSAHNVLASLSKTVEQLEQVNAMMVDRELQLLGLKKELNALKKTH
ncbi:PAS domain-containing protein [Polaromonas sp.]|nr:PAS domain-containing protein [Candidatus Saccharibacteria bacterium]